MNFQFSSEQLQIQDAIERLCKPFDFHKALADAGWLGTAIPQEYRGAGLGITEVALMMRAISGTGAR